MTRFLIRRTAEAVGVLLILTVLVFVLQTLTPGDPARAYLGGTASPSAVAAERVTLGLDKPLPVRYVKYLDGLVHGSLGVSVRTHRAVTSDLGSYLPATVELVFVAFIMALILGGGFAMSGALRWPGSGLVRGTLLLGATAPPFLLALAGIILFYGHLNWLPATGRTAPESTASGFVLVDSLVTGHLGTFGTDAKHIVMPALVLAIAPAVAIGRILRSSLEQTLQLEHVRTARSKGLRNVTVLVRHVLRNSVGPGLSMAGLQLGFMFAGVVVVEQIFSWPGIGNYLADSIPVSDFPAIAAVTLLLGAVYVVTNAAVDILQALADPRITL